MPKEVNQSEGLESVSFAKIGLESPWPFLVLNNSDGIVGVGAQIVGRGATSRLERSIDDQMLRGEVDAVSDAWPQRIAPQ